ncbi:sulfite exporter TauE/SafE family protein [Actinophytocola gossypii]|uniref:Probable membrane transporter protein n=1 Tax=Actinophytocola gossypii TaxID=2812003 RepID=A0ABT2JK83_9PSEU|nr:sulfite exporter TauE/SafE family protein [Actinophytocola gossypii]MCT2588300.1 sulfite exporter TauE/SafE family protein [Actinophytocola gossypii]
MTPLEGVLVAVVGVVAGGMNAVVGSGTLVTFPVLLAIGYPPVIANVSNGIGLVPGSVSGAVGYRRELAGQRGRLLRLGAMSALGAVAGALVLLVLPPGAFELIVPWLILLALVLVLIQPWLARRLAARTVRHEHGGPVLMLGVLTVGVYGGYFGASQGVLNLALMGIMLDEDLQRLNAAKNVLTATANLVAGLVFVFVADVAWPVVLLLAAGSMIGGHLGASMGRRLRPLWLRILIVVVGVVAIVQILVS